MRPLVKVRPAIGPGGFGPRVDPGWVRFARLVIEGRGTVVTGGTLKDERRTNPQNLQGSAIEGGASRTIGKGDFVLVPEQTAHGFTPADGALVLMSVHLPHGK